MNNAASGIVVGGLVVAAIYMLVGIPVLFAMKKERARIEREQRQQWSEREKRRLEACFRDWEESRKRRSEDRLLIGQLQMRFQDYRAKREAIYMQHVQQVVDEIGARHNNGERKEEVE